MTPEDQVIKESSTIRAGTMTPPDQVIKESMPTKNKDKDKDTDAQTRKRRRVVADFKAKQEYKDYIAMLPKDQRNSSAPNTPNADDSNISKRTWERHIKERRKDVRRWVT